MNSLVLAIIGIAMMGAGYLLYSKFLGKSIFRLSPNYSTPAHTMEDGVDYVPTNKYVLWGHHFTSVAGAAPIIGPAVAVIWGWVPAFLWVTLGTVFFAGMHDLGALWASQRHKGQSIGTLSGRYIGKRGRNLFLIVIFLLLLMVNAAFAVVISNLLVSTPTAVIPTWGAVVVALLEEIRALASQGTLVTPQVIAQLMGILGRDAAARPSSALNQDILSSRGRTIRPKTINQKLYVDAIDDHTVTFGIGPAGTGKTYLAMAKAVQALQRKEVSRLILTRPAVEAGERLGFLPGSLNEKIDPYLRPLFDALHEMLDPDAIPKLMEAGTIEVAPLAYMRGRTLNDSFIILDEAQNTTPEQMKMFLTRLGFGSQIVVTASKEPFTFCLVAAFIYLCLTIVAMIGMHFLEKRASRGFVRSAA